MSNFFVPDERRDALSFSAPERIGARAALEEVCYSLVDRTAEQRLEELLSGMSDFDRKFAPLAVLTWGDATAVLTGYGCLIGDDLISSIKTEIDEIREAHDGAIPDGDAERIRDLRVAIRDIDEAVRRRNWLHPKLRLFQAGAVPGARLLSAFNYVMPSGFAMMIGKGASGKSYVAHMLAGMDSDGEQTAAYGLMRVGEPLAGYTHEDADNAVNLLTSLFLFDVVVVDSVKDLLALSGGGRMKSGISRQAVSSFSPWSSMACDLGVCVIAIVNIATPDSEAVDTIVEAARSNATSVIVHVDNGNWHYFSRRGEGLFRRDGYIRVASQEDGGAVVIEPSEEPRRSSAPASGPTHNVSVSVSYNDLMDAVRRALLSSNAG